MTTPINPPEMPSRDYPLAYALDPHWLERIGAVVCLIGWGVGSLAIGLLALAVCPFIQRKSNRRCLSGLGDSSGTSASGPSGRAQEESRTRKRSHQNTTPGRL